MPWAAAAPHHTGKSTTDGGTGGVIVPPYVPAGNGRAEHADSVTCPSTPPLAPPKASSSLPASAVPLTCPVNDFTPIVPPRVLLPLGPRASIDDVCSSTSKAAWIVTMPPSLPTPVALACTTSAAALPGLASGMVPLLLSNVPSSAFSVITPPNEFEFVAVAPFACTE